MKVTTPLPLMLNSSASSPVSEKVSVSLESGSVALAVTIVVPVEVFSGNETDVELTVRSGASLTSVMVTVIVWVSVPPLPSSAWTITI